MADAYNTTDTNWNGTGGTEADWRKRYPVPGAPAAPGAAAPAGQPQLETNPSYAAPAPQLSAPSGQQPMPGTGTPKPGPDNIGIDMGPLPPGAAPAPAAPAPPTPPSPKPGPDWVPTQDGMGWVPPNHPMAWKAPVTPGAVPGAAPGAPAAPSPADQQNAAFHDALMKIMGTDPAGVTADSPAIRAQTNAFDAQRQLAQRREQSSIAERMGAQHLGDSGAMDTAIQGSQEAAGHDTAAFTGQLVGQEVTQRRDMLKTALALSGDQMNANEKNALERELAQLDAQVKREGIASSDRLGQGDLDLRKYLGDNTSSLGLLHELMGNDQFNKSLGFNMDNAEAGHNMDWVRLLMGIH